MPEEQARPEDYIPFIPNSVNILTAPTNSGKTTFLIDTLRHLNLYYTGPVEGVIVVLCNSCVDGEIYKQLESEHFNFIYVSHFIIHLHLRLRLVRFDFDFQLQYKYKVISFTFTV